MKNSKRLLCIALALVLLGSLFACLIQTDGFKVRVKDIYLPTNDQQYLHAYAYIPKSASAENKCPVVLTCHGWLNSAEMQDAACIELSRRGVMVISMDAYSHGMSSNAPDSIMASTGVDGLGYLSLIDYCTSGILNYIDTDRIGIMSHSMGGSAFGGAMVVIGQRYLDAVAAAQAPDSDGGEEITEKEQAYCDAQYPIDSILSTGNCDVTVTRCFDTLKCNFGVLIGEWEESSKKSKDAAAQYDFGLVHNDVALTVLKTIDPEATFVEKDKYYGNREDGTLRVFYEPAGTTHPMDHILPGATEKVIEYWSTVWDLDTDLGSKDQIYLLKKLCNTIAMIGLLMAVVPGVALLLKIPCFESLSGSEGPKLGPWDDKKKKTYWKKWVINAAVSIGTALFVIWWFFKPSWNTVIGAHMIKNTYFMSCTNMNVIWVWTLLNTIWLMISFWTDYKKDKAVGIRNDEMIGWKLKKGEFWKMLAFTAVVMFLFYSVVWFCKWLFNTDFRFLEAAIKEFNPGKLWQFIQYVPVFFLFYLALSLNVNGGQRFEGMNEKKYLFFTALGATIAPLVLFLVQYGSVALTGYVVMYGDWIATFWIIWVFWQLFLAPYFLRAMYKLTGKNWVAPMIVASLYTMIGVANTSIACYWF